jgi:hypothetical protein
MAEPTVSAGYAKSLVDLALAKGVDRALLLERARIDPDDLKHPDNRLPFERFKALMRVAKDLCKMSIVGLITNAAATMGEAFEQMNRYARLVIEVDGRESGDRFAIVRGNGKVWIEDRRRNPDDFPELTESTWARFVCEYRRYFPRRPPF